ncbi:MAG: asparagine synthase-related protein [Thermincola sp.]|nr:asparagine synthase-related protein [Thermincola sp.]MDT3704283.1 asparagine synthase-related protein [Thermincola sp.]
MSAIAGIFHLDGETVKTEHSSRIIGALQKYPADRTQTWAKENVFLGCHAQWITPESAGEQLPYYDHKRKLAITADAIIDNRDELLERLHILQAYRKTISDSELILLAYQEWGEEAPKNLIGDFAFMIWDEKKRRFFGARDFSGCRTLYYFRTPQRFVFCSVIYPLFSLPYVHKELNEQWLAEFLAIPGPHDSTDITSTVYQNIEQLPPSHSISISSQGVKTSRYCTLTGGERLHFRTNQDYEEAFRDVFQSAVTARLRTHRNVGAHLSGGLDSGSVVSFAAKALQEQAKKLYTFSYVPTDDFVDWTPKHRIADERPLIIKTIRYVGNIKDNFLDCAGKSPFSEIDDMLETIEMPYKFFENSFWIKEIYEQAQKLNIGVLLNGARGNFTISWGPALDYYASLLKKLKWIRLYREIYFYCHNMDVGRRRTLSIVRKKAFPFIERAFAPKDRYTFPELINPEFAKKTGVFNRLHEQGVNIGGSSTPSIYEGRKQQFEQLYYWNLNGTMGSKLSLRYSVWDRDPTNDLRVVRFCMALPEEQCVQNGVDRALVRRSTKGFLPDEVRLNQRVRGIQGADGVHRMLPAWNKFIDEILKLMADNNVSEFLNLEAVKAAISAIGSKPSPENAFDSEFKVLMRSLITYRFIKKFL